MRWPRRTRRYEMSDCTGEEPARTPDLSRFVAQLNSKAWPGLSYRVDALGGVIELGSCGACDGTGRPDGADPALIALDEFEREKLVCIACGGSGSESGYVIE